MPRGRLPTPRTTAPVHIHWKRMRTYTGIYKPRKGDPITVKSLSRPPSTRVFRSATGRRKYRLIKLTSTVREVIVVAKTKSRKKAVEPEEIAEIEALEELEDDDEDEEPAVEVEDDEDEDEAPKSKKGKTKTKGKTSRAKANGRVGTAELAEHFGVDSRTLRMVLRKHSIEKDEDSGRYEWDSMDDKTVKKIGKLIKAGEADNIKKEALDKLKARKAEKDAAAKKGKGKKGKKAKKVVEEDEDDD